MSPIPGSHPPPNCSLKPNGTLISIWLTGPKTRVDEVLDGLGAYSTNFEDHPSMVLVGDGRSGDWSRFFGFPSPDRIMDQVNALQAARQTAAGG